LAEIHGETVKFLCRDDIFKEKYDLLSLSGCYINLLIFV